MNNPFRNLPSVNAVLDTAPLIELRSQYGPAQITAAVRAELADARMELQDGHAALPEVVVLAKRVAERLTREERPTLRPVINATGIVLHTNLGRAPLAEAGGTRRL